jgi:hypothetical protein
MNELVEIVDLDILFQSPQKDARIRGKIPNVERCETFQSEEPVKPLN